MRLPKKLITVTSFSKTLAIIFFILLLFIGFYLGMWYQQVVMSETTQIGRNTTHLPLRISSWRTFISKEYHFSFQYPAYAKVVGDGPESDRNNTVGEGVNVSGPGLDMGMGVQSSNVYISKDHKEWVLINGRLWHISFWDPHGNCKGLGLGPCESVLDYQTIIENKFVGFDFRNTTDRTIPEAIIATFTF